jgi:hypothetical protein
MSDLHDDDHLRRFDAVDHAVVAYSQSASALQAVPERRPELDWVRSELGLDRLLDPPPSMS